jgi:hypothetical protein
VCANDAFSKLVLCSSPPWGIWFPVLSSHDLDLVAVTHFLDACSVPSGLWCGTDIGLIVCLRHNRTIHKDYVFKRIRNADETMMSLNIPRSYTVDTKGAREPTLRSTYYENQCIRVMLSITTDGHKVSPYIILNHVTIPKTGIFPKDVPVHAKKWLDDR